MYLAFSTSIEPPARRSAPVRRREPAHKVPRGFALYVGLEDDDPSTDLRAVVDELMQHLARVAPGTEATASVVVAPPEAGGRSLDVVRQVLDSRASRPGQWRPTGGPRGVQIDLTRNRVVVDGRPAALTTIELALLTLLVEHAGQDVSRAQIIARVWPAGSSAPGTVRTVDVHVRRLRAKLGAYEDIIRTVRGRGYRFDPHADVTVHGSDVTTTTAPAWPEAAWAGERHLTGIRSAG